MFGCFLVFVGAGIGGNARFGKQGALNKAKRVLSKTLLTQDDKTYAQTTCRSFLGGGHINKARGPD